MCVCIHVGGTRDMWGVEGHVEFWGPWWLDVQQPVRVCEHPGVTLRVFVRVCVQGCVCVCVCVCV